MSEPAKSAVEIKDFNGMASNFDPHDLAPGVSREQINMNGLQRGQLECRRGTRIIQYDSN